LAVLLEVVDGALVLPLAGGGVVCANMTAVPNRDASTNVFKVVLLCEDLFRPHNLMLRPKLKNGDSLDTGIPATKVRGRGLYSC